MTRRTLCACAIALFTARAARANGRFPAAQFVVVGPGPEARTIALRTTFGLVVTDDGGARWSWRCEDEFGYAGRELWDPPLALGRAGPDGAPLFVGVPDGLWRDTSRCAPARVPEAGGEYTGDVTADAAGATLYWASSSAGRPATVLGSDDGGRTWTRRLAGLPDVLFETVESAGSDPSRVYLTGIDLRDGATRLYRSGDGARTLTALDLDLRGGRDAFLAGVDPTRPDTLWLRVPVRDDDAGADGTLLLRSTDAGARFEALYRTRGPMLGFAYSDDGRTLWVGGPDDGLLRSVDGGPFTAVSDVPLRCLRWHAGALYVCEDLARGPVALSVSRDGGATREPLLRVDALTGPSPACAAGTLARDLCAPRWPAVRRALLDPDAGPAPMDAAVAAPPVAEGGSCAVGRAKLRGAWAVCVLLAWRRRRAVSRSRARP